MTFIFVLLTLVTIAATVFSSLKFTKEGKFNETHVGWRPLGTAVGVVALALVVLGWNCYATVEAGTVGVVTRFGKVTRTITPGLHYVSPLESVYPMATRTLVVKPSEDASTKDLQTVHMEVTLAYHFDPAYAAYFFSQLSDSTPNAIENKVVIPAVLEAMKAKSALYDAPELVTNRALVRDQIESFLQAKLAAYHIVPETVSITDFRFSQQYDAAIEAKQTAQQQAEKAQNDLNRVKIEAEQKIAAAQGEAAALKAQKEQITPELLQLRMIEMLKEKWDGALPANYYGGQAPLPIVDAFKGEKKQK